MFGQELFTLDDRAAKSGFILERWTEVPTNSSAAVSVAATSSAVPAGRMRVLQDWSGYMVGGAAQTSNAVKLEVLGPADNVLYTYRTTYTAGNIANVSINKTLNWILLAGEKVRLTATFSAAVAANQVDFNLFGYETPRGNFG